MLRLSCSLVPSWRPDNNTALYPVSGMVLTIYTLTFPASFSPAMNTLCTHVCPRADKIPSIVLQMPFFLWNFLLIQLCMVVRKAVEYVATAYTAVAQCAPQF